MKGEDSFPDLNSDKVKMTFDQRSVKKKTFKNKDRLHNCGDCQDDFKGKPLTSNPILIYSHRSQQRAMLFRSEGILQERDQHHDCFQVHQSSVPSREPAVD